MKRREIIKLLSAAPIAGGILGSTLPYQSGFAEETKKNISNRNLFKELGIKTFINADCTCTNLTASLMPEEVLNTISNGAQEFALLDDIQDKVGEKIATLCHAEAATVTAGCWSALVLGVAGVLTGMDNKKVKQLPFLEGTGMKSEVILQKAHANGYHHALTNAGVSIILVETYQEAEAAINDKTAMLWFLNRELPLGQIKYNEWLALGKKHNIPTMIDIAADAHPVENLWKFNEMGFDLVCLSGGKAIRGPQSSGVLMGKKDLIAAARISASPRASTIGRGHKVNKEEILGLYVAIDRFIRKGEEEWNYWLKQIAHIENAVKNIKGVKTRVFVPEIANATPNLEISWDPAILPLTGEQVQNGLRNGDPGIELNFGKNNISLVTFIMVPGEEKIVATRIREELTKV